MTGERRLSSGLKLATFEIDNFLYLFPSILPVIEFSLPVKAPSVQFHSFSDYFATLQMILNQETL